jgi:hypothetical protein
MARSVDEGASIDALVATFEGEVGRTCAMGSGTGGSGEVEGSSEEWATDEDCGGVEVGVGTVRDLGAVGSSSWMGIDDDGDGDVTGGGVAVRVAAMAALTFAARASAGEPGDDKGDKDGDKEGVCLVSKRACCISKGSFEGACLGLVGDSERVGLVSVEPSDGASNRTRPCSDGASACVCLKPEFKSDWALAGSDRA